jgi:catechol 2,3-dioxygenase-like lactoylglutathione lyase family enzyme
MRIGHIELFVADPMRSLAFYRDVLGFDVTEVQRESVVWLKKGDFEILLRPGNAQAPAQRYADSSQGIVLYTDDLEGTLAELQSRGLALRGTDGPPCCPTFTDPDGHWFQLVDPSEQQ